jgi:histidyl-tRNA synthetase
MELGDKGLKSQMKSADRLGASHVLMIGDKELDEKVAVLRNMQTKEQIPVPFGTLVETVRQLTKKH